MFQLRQLKTFLAAAETLSFTRAAAQVHLSQPSVTEQIQALEHQVGQPLFVRSNNRLQLTEAGERLVGRARELLALADDTLRLVRDKLDGPPGTLRVAAPQTLCTGLLVPLLAGYAGQYPHAQVVVQERNSAATAQAVAEGVVDAGLVHGWPLNAAGLRAELLMRDAPVVVLPAGHPLAGAAEVTANALAAFPLVATEEGCRYRAYLEVLLQQAPVRPHIRAVADSVPALLQMVSTGLGVSILPRMAVHTAAATARVDLRPLASGGEGLPICLLTADREPARHLAAFIALLRLATTVSDQPVPAFDVQHFAGGVGVAHQEQDGIRDVVGHADPAHRQLLRHRGQ